MFQVSYFIQHCCRTINKTRIIIPNIMVESGRNSRISPAVVHDRCVTKGSALNVVKQLVVNRGTGDQSVLGFDDPISLRVVAGDLKFESNPCRNHRGIPQQRCNISQ